MGFVWTPVHQQAAKYNKQALHIGLSTWWVWFQESPIWSLKCYEYRRTWAWMEIFRYKVCTIECLCRWEIIGQGIIKNAFCNTIWFIPCICSFGILETLVVQNKSIWEAKNWDWEMEKVCSIHFPGVYDFFGVLLKMALHPTLSQQYTKSWVDRS